MSESKNPLIAQIVSDYERRRESRRALEAQWRLNANFANGKQYCYSTAGGSIVEQDKRRLWEERAVYNHTASILETRLAKLSKLKPKLTVQPKNSQPDSLNEAKLSSAVIESACDRLGLSDIISEATTWSELTGTAFYKISWDKSKGMVVGIKDGVEVREGDVRVDVCPPYEVFPDDICHPSLEACNSVIHAKAVSVAEIHAKWGVIVEGENKKLGDYSSLSGIFSSDSVAFDGEYALVIERFTRPSSNYPRGRYEVVAGDNLLYEGDLPYKNGVDGERDFPFVRQCCTLSPGAFFGISPIERAIPVQRAYNAVKNRKHEFMNRIASGVLIVEDGSVDVDELECDGLEPGKVLVYRQGSAEPKLLETGEIPSDFSEEEDKLMEEMARVSGISELMRSSTVPSVTSGNALKMLIEQDETRLAVTADHVTSAVKEVGRKILRLYKQFAGDKRLSKVVGESGEKELLCWQASLLGGEISVVAPPEISQSEASRTSILIELVKSGLLGDKGGLDEQARREVLYALGFNELASEDITLHKERARKENEGEIAPEVKSYDDHAVHIKEHVCYLIKNQPNLDVESALEAHIKEHKRAEKEEL